MHDGPTLELTMVEASAAPHALSEKTCTAAMHDAPSAGSHPHAAQPRLSWNVS